MQNKPNWVSLFSQTGTEIVNVSKRLGKWPDLVLTNRTDIEGVNQELLDNCIHRLIMIPDKPAVGDYYAAIGSRLDIDISDNFIVTLHGYLRIIPAELCDKWRVYNGHPGDIVTYPELKGKDPVERVTSEMKMIGAVIHNVTPGIDDGLILMHKNTDLSGLPWNIRKIYIPGTIRQMSEDLWVEFLQNKL